MRIKGTINGYSSIAVFEWSGYEERSVGSMP